MSADFLCWVPALALLPGSSTFYDRVDQLNSPPQVRPAHAIVEFVHALQKRYPELSEKNENTAWADGPMLNDANGEFIDFSIRWDYYDKVIPFVVSTARRFHLDCFDPQDSRFYPESGPAIAVASANPRVTNQAEAIKKAKRVCGLTETAQPGRWQVTSKKGPDNQIEWHVWYGKTNVEPLCGFNGAYVGSGGMTSCIVSLCKAN